MGPLYLSPGALRPSQHQDLLSCCQKNKTHLILPPEQIPQNNPTHETTGGRVTETEDQERGVCSHPVAGGYPGTAPEAVLREKRGPRRAREGTLEPRSPEQKLEGGAAAASPTVEDLDSTLQGGRDFLSPTLLETVADICQT